MSSLPWNTPQQGHLPCHCCFRLTLGSSRLLQAALAVPLIALFMFVSGPRALAEEPVLNVFNWSDYIGPKTLADFTAQTGIKVNYDTFDSNEILEAKLLAGRSGYDVVFPTAMPYLAKQIRAGLYRKLDMASIPNAKGVDPRVMDRLRAADPDNAYALPYTVSATAIGYIKAKIAPLLPNPPIGSLALMFDPKVVKALKRCGVTILDAPDEEFPAALAYLGKDPTSTTEGDLVSATKVLAAARPFYRYIHSSNHINDLASGAICVAHGWTGDLFQARKRAEEAKNGVKIEIFIPSEGTSTPIDVMAIPRDAPHPENAQKFINYILDAKVIAEITNAVGYANAVPSSNAFVAKEVLDDPIVHPPTSVKFYAVKLPTPEYERSRNRAWTRIKTGH